MGAGKCNAGFRTMLARTDHRMQGLQGDARVMRRG